MTDPITVLLALGLGLVIGALAGVRAGISFAVRRRAALGAHAQLARLWPGELPERSAADILAGVIRVRLGGQTYELPVLPRGASRRWLESLDARFAALAAELEAAGNDTPAIMVRLVAEADGLYDMLLAYDAAGSGLLPPKADIDEVASDTEILRAVLEVWRAANPLAASLIEGSGATTPGGSPAPQTSPRRPMAGARRSSSGSPTSSSSPTSTRPRTASSTTRARSSSGSSRRSASARASSTTAGPTPAGGPGSGLATPSPRATVAG